MSKFRLVVSLVIIAMFIGCAATQRNPIMRSRTAASIAVRVDGSVDQETVTLQARNGKASSLTAIPSQIVWVAETGNTLMIEWEDRAQKCVVATHCSDNVCSGLTNTALSTRTECRYRIVVNNTAAHDPIVIVDGCCP